MAKKSRKKRRRPQATVPLTIASSMLFVGGNTYQDYKNHGLKTSLEMLAGNMTGFRAAPGQPLWDFERLKYGFLPLTAGAGMHKIASKLGINRILARAGFPLLRV